MRLRAAWLCAAFIWQASAAETVTEAIDVRGAVETTLHLSVEDLQKFPPDQIVEVTQAPRDAGGTPSKLRGVRLAAILDRARLASRERNDWKKAVVLATASDGYRVVFSWPEIYNTEIGGTALVVFERDGKPLGSTEGRLSMFSAQDRNTGPRHVKWLQAIEVRVLAQ